MAKTENTLPTEVPTENTAPEVQEQEELTEEEKIWGKKVKIRLPIIPGQPKQEALFVGCNTRTWVIPRGKEMEVPECVVEIINHSEEEMIRAAQFREANEKG